MQALFAGINCAAAVGWEGLHEAYATGCGRGRNFGRHHLAFAGVLQPAAAQSAEEFYRGKQITLIIGLGAGETYDLYARLLARHL
jgi:hypothetical protein